MWTYLLLFLSVISILSIFVYRIVFVIRGKDLIKDDLKNRPDDLAVVIKKKVKLSRKQKEEVNTLYKKGASFLEDGKEDEAIKSFVQALAIDPKHKESMNKLGVLYMHKQMYSAACAVFKELCELEENAVYLSHLGLALYNLQEYERALEAYKKAIMLDYDRSARFVSLCQVYRALNNNRMALISLNKALDLEADNIEYMFLLSEILFEMDQFEEAKDVVRKILFLDPENEEAKRLLRKRRN
ncbi:MAG: tetratricopeptide repeat protein [Candidatus Gracilibacteria bacterium]|jgi:tetratricopeptide (TPR) repeat protein|nr:tetratricopeptide repeat protein [Candidatus Gracilibacteria bacterium]